MNDEQESIDLTGIVVVGERRDDLASLAREYWAALAATQRSFELIFVLDGQREDALSALTEARSADTLPIRILRLSRAFGEATALMCGVDHARGERVVTLPPYYQVDPAELPRLVETSAEYDMLVVRRIPRRGGAFERLRRRVFHRILHAITGHRFNDLGCYVRILNRKVLRELRLYGDQHRFLPVLAQNAGFSTVEVEARQSEHDDFRSRYRIREYMHRLLDIFTIFFLVRFTKKPLRFFGMIGSIIGIVGGLILVVLVIQRLFLDMPLADRPALLLSSLLAVLGLQLFSLGLLGELIIFTHARSLKEYKIAEIIEADQADNHYSDNRDSDKRNRAG
ncbi:MAG: glycosyltransferase [Woeseiaceae bacterium]